MIDTLFESFKKSTVLVIGDVMIDAYLKGSVSRISPEAPVPIVEVGERSYRIGGAANVALNLKSLGATPILCSVIGQDEKGSVFCNLLKDNDLSEEGIVTSTQRRTTVKYRVIGNKSQMLRIDEEDTCLLNETESDLLMSKIQSIFDGKRIDAVIFEDYDKGVLSKDLIRNVIRLAKATGALVTVDPKKRNFFDYDGADLFKPNLKELLDGLNDNRNNLPLEKIRDLMSGFAKRKNIAIMMTTLSERGIAVYDEKTGTFFNQPAFLRKISDVSGAGDTVISVATLCLVAGIPVERTAVIANLAGGIVCEYAGVVPIGAEILKQHIISNS